MKYSKENLQLAFIIILFIYVGGISLFTIIVLTILKFCWLDKLRNRKGENNNFVAPLFQKENGETNELLKEKISWNYIIIHDK